MSAYPWTDETYPSKLPIEAREAYHRKAWSDEQAELGALVGRDVEEHLKTSLVTEAAMHPDGI